uniref:Uncharacterized protein n=1 Tax=Vespula pensylvanica TaxID=30213 RepID=A0A834P7Q0_VESPE|nr:hypothetical protein H0235_004541 [Vespula pensylvanica]
MRTPDSSDPRDSGRYQPPQNPAVDAEEKLSRITGALSYVKIKKEKKPCFPQFPNSYSPIDSLLLFNFLAYGSERMEINKSS